MNTSHYRQNKAWKSEADFEVGTLRSFEEYAEDEWRVQDQTEDYETGIVIKVVVWNDIATGAFTLRR
jgi:hypothetical protein